MPKTKIATKSYDMASMVVSIAFTNGFVATLDCTKLNDETKQSAMFHGLIQKLGDTYAGEQDVEKAKTKVLRIIESLENNQWRMPRSASESSTAVTKANASGFVAILSNTALFPQMDEAEMKAKCVEIGIPEATIPLVIAELEAQGYFRFADANDSTPADDVANETILRLRKEATK